jgi:hypothetical protein
MDHNSGYREKQQHIRKKLAKIAENNDNNIDPRFPEKIRVEASKKIA